MPVLRSERAIAVALHGIEPATFERCALIRDWLGDHGVQRVTLLVIPARDLHPVGERSPAMVQWLRECQLAGDSIAQHGFQHGRPRAQGQHSRMLARARPQRSGEFVGLDEDETRRAVHAGWRVLKLAGIEPDGFVAPAYAWAGLLRIHRTGEKDDAAPLAPAWSLAAPGPVSRAVSPPLVRLGSLLPASTLRLDIHPAYLQHPRHMLALEWVLARTAGHRDAVTYRELAGV